MYKEILVALDDSEPSNNALEHAVSIATYFKAKLIMLAVIQRVMIPIFPDEGFGGIPLSSAKDMAKYQEKMREVYQSVLDDAMIQIKEEHPGLMVEAVARARHHHLADIRHVNFFTGWCSILEVSRINRSHTVTPRRCILN